MSRVVITGLGVVSPIGIGKEVYFANLIKGVSGVNKISSFDASNYQSQIAGEVKDFEPEKFIDKKEIGRMDRFTQFAVAGAKLAIEDAGLNITNDICNSVGTSIASGIGGFITMEKEENILQKEGNRRVSPFCIPMIIPNIASGIVAIIFSAKGPSICIVTACAASSHAIGESYEIIKRGDAKVMITGGADAAITPLGLAGFCNMRALSKRNDVPKFASRPFDKLRDGFVISEGAGVLILEELNFAKERGAKIHCEITGYGASCDAYHITAPDPEGDGAKRCMEMAVKKAGINCKDINYINAHGTSTQLNDKLETRAIKNLFGDYAYSLFISSNKSMIGHTLGAAGALELIATVLTIKEGIIPPTINLEDADPECDLNFVPNYSKKSDVNIAMSNSFGFGGHNATLIVKKYENS